MSAFYRTQIVRNTKTNRTGQVQDIWFHDLFQVDILTVWVESIGETQEWSSRHAEPLFLPKTGDLFTRPGNDKYALLVITPEQEIADNGYIVYGVIVWMKRGDPISYSAPRLLSVYPTDNHVCHSFPLPEAAQLALDRRNAIYAKTARGESLNDDDHHSMTLCGLSSPLPASPRRNEMYSHPGTGMGYGGADQK